MSYRAFVLPVGGIAAVLAGVLLFGDLTGNLVYYLRPSEAVADRADFGDGRRFRLAGEVVAASVTADDTVTRFAVTDGTATVAVAHRGAPPQLFREGIEVVVEGAWDGDVFRSDTILIKHDEEYRAPDLEPASAEGRP